MNLKGLAPEVGRGECQLSPGRLTPRETPTGVQRTKGRVEHAAEDSCHSGEKKKLSLLGIEHRFVGRPARSPFTIMTELSRFPRLLKSQETIIYIFHVLISTMSSGKNEDYVCANPLIWIF